MRRAFLTAVLLIAAGCLPRADAVQTVNQRAGAWWGDVNTPLKNQVWVEAFDATPAKNLTGPRTYHWTCQLPSFPGFPNTERLLYSVIQKNSSNLKTWSNPTPGQQFSYTLDPGSSHDRIEVRIRCVARETQGPNTGHETGATLGFPVQLNGGTGGDVWQHHNLNRYTDAHGWYDRGVEYEYAIWKNAADLAYSPVRGTIPIELQTERNFGDTVQAHAKVSVDGVTKAEWSGTAALHTVWIDTTKLSNGPHVFAVHGHALETQASEQPGMQIAGEVSLRLNVQN